MNINRPPIITAYLGLGSNLASPVEQIKSARFAITTIQGVEELTFSSLYNSLPMGHKDQPNYVNAVMAISTELSALDLLHSLQQIENAHGRTRTCERWESRTLDLDILMYGNQCINLPELIVPHQGIVDRAFVLYPWHEIAPNLTIPEIGNLSELLANCSTEGLKRLD